jgi:hypothetical protein
MVFHSMPCRIRFASSTSTLNPAMCIRVMTVMTVQLMMMMMLLLMLLL